MVARRDYKSIVPERFFSALHGFFNVPLETATACGAALSASNACKLLP